MVHSGVGEVGPINTLGRLGVRFFLFPVRVPGWRLRSNHSQGPCWPSVPDERDTRFITDQCRSF